MCTVRPSHSKWLSKYSNDSVWNFVLSLTIPLQKLSGWFRKPQLWATGDQQLHHDNMPTHLGITSRAEIFCETSNHPGDSTSLHPRFGTLQLLAFPKTKITFKREEISDYQWDSGKIWQGNWWQLGEQCEKRPCLCLLWRGLKCHCPMYNVSCIFFNKCLYFLYHIAGYFLDRPHI